MPNVYRTISSSENSEFEDEVGNKYHPRRTIGTGRHSQARELQAVHDHQPGPFVVLSPVADVPVDLALARSKALFFNSLYGFSQVFSDANTYRVIVPRLPGEPYTRYRRHTHLQVIGLCLSAITALKRCHARGMVFIDLKEDNILFDQSSSESYLVDGDLATNINTPLTADVFCKADPLQIAGSKRRHSHIAPECWFIAPSLVMAHPSMDVYSLAVMMIRLLRDASLWLDEAATRVEFIELMQQHSHQDPAQRPTLASLEGVLQGMLMVASLAPASETHESPVQWLAY